MGIYINSLFKDTNDHKIIPRGLLSESTLSCIFGTVSTKHWIGDDSLLSDSPLIYSAEALSNVIALQLKKCQLSGLPKECLEGMVDTTKNKLVWLKERMLSNNRVNTNVLKKEGENKIFQVALNNLSMRYPIANEETLHKLRNQRFAHLKPTKRALLNINLDAYTNATPCHIGDTNKTVNCVSFFNEDDKVPSPKKNHFLSKISILQDKSGSTIRSRASQLPQACTLKFTEPLFVIRKHSDMRDKIKRKRNISFAE